MPGARLKVELTGIGEAERRLRALGGRRPRPDSRDAETSGSISSAPRKTGSRTKGGRTARLGSRSPSTPSDESVATPGGSSPSTDISAGRSPTGQAPTEVLTGSPLVYAGTQQFGAEEGSFGSASGGRPIPWGDIPAREFLGLSDADGDEIEVILRDYLLVANLTGRYRRIRGRLWAAPGASERPSGFPAPWYRTGRDPV